MPGRQIRRPLVAAVGAATTLASPWVMAHLGADMSPHGHDGSVFQDLIAGALHPLSGLDHLAAMLSVGAWSALNHRCRFDKGLLIAPAAFATMLLLGAIAGMAGLHLAGVEPMIAASLLVLGLLVSTRLKLPTGVGAALVAVFALFHGLAHGSELGGHAFAALSGMSLSTVGLHGLGIVIGLRLNDPHHDHQRWLTRMAGAVVALLGLSMLTPAILL